MRGRPARQGRAHHPVLIQPGDLTVQKFAVVRGTTRRMQCYDPCDARSRADLCGAEGLSAAKERMQEGRRQRDQRHRVSPSVSGDNVETVDVCLCEYANKIPTNWGVESDKSAFTNTEMPRELTADVSLSIAAVYSLQRLTFGHGG